MQAISSSRLLVSEAMNKEGRSAISAFICRDPRERSEG